MAKMHYADPPVLIRDVIDDLDRVYSLLSSCAPYTPLGGWYNPGADPDAATSAMWFQQDWVHADYRAQARTSSCSASATSRCHARSTTRR